MPSLDLRFEFADLTIQLLEVVQHPIRQMANDAGSSPLACSTTSGARSPSRYKVAAGDTAALLECIAKAKRRFGLPADAPVVSCYEAGRDGFWLHR